MSDYNRKRGSSTQQGYGSQWSKVSKAFLQAHPFCQCDRACCPEGCNRRSTEVDHIEPRPREAPFDRSRWDRDGNLRALAGTPCHRRITMRATNARRKAGSAASRA